MELAAALPEVKRWLMNWAGYEPLHRALMEYENIQVFLA